MVITKDRYRVCQATYYNLTKIDKADDNSSLKVNKRNFPVENAEELDS